MLTGQQLLIDGTATSPQINDVCLRYLQEFGSISDVKDSDASEPLLRDFRLGTIDEGQQQHPPRWPRPSGLSTTLPDEVCL